MLRILMVKIQILKTKEVKSMFTSCDESLITEEQNILHGFSHQPSESFFEEELTENYQSAFDLYRKNLKAEKLTTGSTLLDLLIGGGVETSTFTLFYGDRRILRILVHKLLVNALLDTKRGGFASPAIYVCCSNYRKERTVLNTYYLADIALSVGVNPTVAFKNIYVAMAFNPLEEYMISRATGKVARKTGSKLILVDNIALLLCDEKMREEFPDITLTSVVGGFWEAAFRNDAALVATCREAPSNRRMRRGIPLPEGCSVLMERAGVVVYFRVGYRRVPFAKAYLRKHPFLANREVTFTFNRYRLFDGLFRGDFFG